MASSRRAASVEDDQLLRAARSGDTRAFARAACYGAKLNCHDEVRERDTAAQFTTRSARSGLRSAPVQRPRPQALCVERAATLHK